MRDDSPPTARRVPIDQPRPTRFHVELTYREPTYAAARGIELRDYRALYDLEAPDADAAETEARRAFAEAARSSSVGWVREIVGARVDRLA